MTVASYHIRNALGMINTEAAPATRTPLPDTEPTLFLEIGRDGRQFFMDIRNHRKPIPATRYATITRLLETGDYGTPLGAPDASSVTWELTSAQLAALIERVKTGTHCVSCGVILLEDEEDLCGYCQAEMEADDRERELIAERATMRVL